MSPEHELEPIFVFLHTTREETMSPGLLSSSGRKTKISLDSLLKTEPSTDLRSVQALF